MGSMPDKVGASSSSSSLMSTLGVAKGLGMFTINDYAKLTSLSTTVSLA